MSDALNMELTADWKREINSSRHEMDLALVIQDLSLLVQVETKGGRKSTEATAVRQVEWGKGYLERSHGQLLQDFTFLPVLAMPNPALKMRKTEAANCPEFYLMDDDFSAFQSWWEQLTKAKAGTLVCADQDKYEAVLRRLVLHSSLAFTSLPQQLSTVSGSHMIDTHLIMLR